ncbi:MAG: hypothetical protein HPY59_16365 [Anaerolineae bacterium]|nr:hypothetical protein [Anaerolineae bacterium]
MYDVTFLIPDYPDWQNEMDYIPPDPGELMPERVKNELFDEFCDLLESGAFDQDRELPY